GVNFVKLEMFPDGGISRLRLFGNKKDISVLAGPYDGWQPHAYCNDLAGMDATAIAPLSAEQAESVVSLEQVQIIARHGARAPYARLFCWDYPKHNPMNAKWNCTTTSVSNQNIGFDPETGFGRLYRKGYMSGQNILSGNCVVGGLLPLGRQQHLKNGLILRDAYQLPLDQFFLRSDDQERTLGSGQALLDGIFPPDGRLSRSIEHMLNWNVADYATDHVNANDKICPLMGFIGNLSNNSPAFLEYTTAAAQVKTEREFKAIVGNFSWDSALECLSTARCNDLPLPAGIDEDTFTRVFHEVEVRQQLYYSYNSSWFAKVAMQPLMSEIITRLDALVEGKPTAPKFALTMGHDSTIMPFMAAVVKDNWDGKWTPYAGMLTMEVYKLKSASFAVRMLFQGTPVHIPDCKDTLCTLEEFESAIAFGRTRRNCSAPEDDTSSSDLSSSGAQQRDHFTFSQYLSASILLGLVALCAVLGLRSQRKKPKSRWGDEGANLLG
ncbi:hypothetical protein PybrP1_007243, partial [[Pythium] brassicae (nom. inval.)]